MWPIDEIDDRIKRYNDKKRETYSKYIALADHKIEWAEIALSRQDAAGDLPSSPLLSGRRQGAE